MEPVKVVVRYADGRLLKGYTQDFFPNRDRFHLHLAENLGGQAVEVFLKELKAIFFVQSFNGDPGYKERKSFAEGEKVSGKKVEVSFHDGEVIVGSTLGYDPNRQGFFVFPADPNCNNIRVFAISKAVKRVRNL